MVIGIDIGGTSFKIGLVDDNGVIINKFSIPVDHHLNQIELIEDIANKVNLFIKENNFTNEDFKGIGIGCPGAINTTLGTCDFSGNLRFNSLEICKIISNITSLPCKITNDAQAATLGEAKFGAGKNYQNLIMLTLGTGVGGGIIINGKTYEGKDGKGGELGHTLLVMNGHKCTCGRRGCVEAYVSATALIASTKRAMKRHSDSMMWSYVDHDINKVNGKTAFECSKLKDQTAIEVIDTYISYLGETCLNFANIFRPDAFIIGGGLSAQKEYLTDKLYKYCEDRHFGFKMTPEFKVLPASLGNDAGIIGAACLMLD